MIALLEGAAVGSSPGQSDIGSHELDMNTSGPLDAFDSRFRATLRVTSLQAVDTVAHEIAHDVCTD